MRQIITTVDGLEAMVEAYMGFDAFAFDVETLGTRPPLFDKDKPALDWRTNEVFWISFAGPGRSDVIPIGHPKGELLEPEYTVLCPAAECPAPARCKQCGAGREAKITKTGKPSKAKVRHDIAARFGPPPAQLTHEDVWHRLHPLFLSDKVKVGHNLKFDVKSTAKYMPDGKPMPGPFRCTDIGWRIEDENHISYRLGDVTDRCLDWLYDKSLGKAGVENFPFTQAATYARCDSVASWLGYRELERRLKRQGDDLVALYEGIEMPTLAAVINMEMAGAPMDVEGIRKLEEGLRGRLAELQLDIEEVYGGEINLNADAQVRRLVYEKLGFKPYEFTEKAGEPATSKSALEKFAYKDPRAAEPVVKNKTVANILEWAETHKLWSTFAVPLLAYAEAGDGRIYASFDQLGARTGRFSCREPNLQQIPVRRGKEVRDLFIAPPGYVLVVSDYSQVELRVLAHFTEDPMLLKAYRENLDLHEMTARGAYKIPDSEEVPTKKRSLAKNVNFSMAYGGTAWTIMTRYEVPEEEAELVVDGFYATYKKVQPWKDRQLKKYRDRGRSKVRHGKHIDPYASTICGRRRRLPDLLWPRESDPDKRKKKIRAAERQAINSEIQGSAGDMAKLAMIELDQRLPEVDGQLIMMVHDELVVLVPEEKAEQGVALVKECMESVEQKVKLKVPLIADAKTANKWGDAK